MVNKVFTLTFALLLIAPAIFTQKNTCESGKCEACELAGTDKQCSNCAGIYELQTPAGQTLKQCVKPNPFLANCANYDKGDCYACETGRVLKNNNCETTGSISKCLNVYDDAGTNKCRDCDKGYLVSADGLKCEEVDTAATGYDKNCEVYRRGSGTTIGCSVCKPGFIRVNNVCTAYTGGSLGCSTADSASAPCKFCNTLYNYWAVDYDATKGVVCEGSSIINKIATALVILIGMTQF